MKNFIDFVTDASNNKRLSDELSAVAETGSHETVSRWFGENGYSVSGDECRKLVENDGLLSRNVGLYPY